MSPEQTKIPSEKLPAFYEQFCHGMTASVGHLQRMHSSHVQQANIYEDERERQSCIASAAAIDACLTTIAQAYAQAAVAVGEPAIAIELAQRFT